MKLSTQMSTFRFTEPTALRVVRWTTIDAILGAAGGFLFGGTFGGLWIYLGVDSTGLLPTAAYFAVCGAIAGAVVGALAATFESEQAVEEREAPQVDSWFWTTPVAPRFDILADSQYQPRNRLAAVNCANERRLKTVASQNGNGRASAG